MKTLIAYFSASSQTAKLTGIVKGELFAIKPEMPHPAADLDWRDKASRTSVVMRGASYRKPGKRLKANATAPAVAKWPESEGRLP